jgi:hypothetical protein
VLLVESEDHPGPFGEQVAAVAGNLAELGERSLDVERFRSRVTAAVQAIWAVVIPSGSSSFLAWWPCLDRTSGPRQGLGVPKSASRCATRLRRYVRQESPATRNH